MAPMDWYLLCTALALLWGAGSAQPDSPYSLKFVDSYQEFPGAFTTGDANGASVFWQKDGRLGFIAGEFYSSVDFGPGHVIQNTDFSELTSEIFVTKLVPFEDRVIRTELVRQSDSPDSSEVVGQICSTEDSRFIYVVGTAHSPTGSDFQLDFGAGVTLPEAGGSYDGEQSAAFLVKYNKRSLQPQWARGQTSGSVIAQSTGRACSVDSTNGDIVIAGTYRMEDTVAATRFEGSGNIVSLELTNGFDPYVCRYSEDGTVERCWRARGPALEDPMRMESGLDEVVDVITEPIANFEDRIVVLGYSTNSDMAFFSGVSLSFSSTPATWVVRYNHAGVTLQAEQYYPAVGTGLPNKLAFDTIELFYWVCGTTAANEPWLLQLDGNSLFEFSNTAFGVNAGMGTCNGVTVGSDSAVAIVGQMTDGLDTNTGGQWDAAGFGAYILRMDRLGTVEHLSFFDSTCLTIDCGAYNAIDVNDANEYYVIGNIGAEAEFTTIVPAPANTYVTDVITASDPPNRNVVFAHYVPLGITNPTQNQRVKMYQPIYVTYNGFTRDSLVEIEFRSHNGGPRVTETSRGSAPFKMITPHHINPGKSVVIITGLDTGQQLTSEEFRIVAQ